MPRRFKYSGSVYAPLSNNSEHSFALQHAMKLYHADAVYTYIPKNACSTMRLSLAIENGFISGPERVNWIHSNIETFAASNQDAITASFAFVVLRCPFRRIYSAYMDKIVNMDIQSWILYDGNQRRIHPHDITFADFIGMMEDPILRNLNHHWKPQTAFLLFEEYDAYYALEQFDQCANDLKTRLDFNIVDARNLTGHSTDKFQKVDLGDEASSMPALKILNLKKENKIPSESSLFTNIIIQKVADIYARDLEIYSHKFGNSGLLFN